ncbi:MAG: KTSC domain-containing protein [candidate division KSB1 bacterium]|nr:KTSC domain-containing protein [candidate division KSB1 bacterium]
MQRVPVQSSNLASVGYDPVSSILEIEFHNGGIYQYLGVPQEIYDGLMYAASKGSYFHHYIKEAGYSYAKVG